MWESRRHMDGLEAPKTDPHSRGRAREFELLAYLGDGRHELSGREVANVREPIARPRERQRAITQLCIEVRTQWGRRRRVAAGEAQDNVSHTRRQRDLDVAYRGVHDARLHGAILQAAPGSRDTHTMPSGPIP
jgi:hypothetical protein